MAALAFTSCDKDDDNKPGSSGGIVGEWVIVAEKGHIKIDGEHTEDSPWDETYDAKDEVFGYNFDKDGSYYDTDYDTGEWIYKNDKLTLIPDDKDGLTIEWKVLTLNNSRLIIEFSGKYEEDGETLEVYAKETYVKL